MTTADADWETRASELWGALDRSDEDDFVSRLDALVAELPPGSPIGLFERGAAFDSTGRPERAVPLYQARAGRRAGG